MARILLADDDAATRDLVQRALAFDGHEVVPTADGAEALAQLKRGAKRFDLLISDMQMPGMSGAALVEKGLAAAPNLRVILMSGFVDEVGLAQQLRPKVARVITKPFTLEQVRGVVRDVLA